MSDKEFFINLLIVILVFIVVMTAIVMVFLLAKKRIKIVQCYDILEDLQDTINCMSRDVSVNKQYVYSLGHYLRVLKDYVE